MLTSRAALVVVSLICLGATACAASQSRAEDARALAQACAALSCPETFAAGKARGLAACPRTVAERWNLLLVRSCAHQDQMRSSAPGGLTSTTYSFAKGSGRVTSVCRGDDTPPLMRCTGEALEERSCEDWEPLCPQP